MSLANKRILLGITGGIAAYKCAELTRLFIKAGAEVQIAMTRAATEFVTPLTLQALSGNRVHLDLLDTEAEAAMGHIELARWADFVLIAPCTADFMARMAQGKADDLLSTLILATKAPVAIAPAMNQAMWADSATQDNLALLRSRAYQVFGPGSGEQACGDVGLGRMLEPEQLIESCSSQFDSGILDGRKVVITGGPTREAIDPVRFISNHSSGKMAYALAAQAAALGAKVTLVSGPVNLAVPEHVTCKQVTSADEMLASVLESVRDCDVFVGVAAVADYRPVQVETKKIKKNDDSMILELVKNPDIISRVSQLDERPSLVVGFAAETEDIIKHGKQKLQRKGLDLLFANNATETFNSDAICVTALSKEEEIILGPASKMSIATKMLTMIANLLK